MKKTPEFALTCGSNADREKLFSAIESDRPISLMAGGCTRLETKWVRTARPYSDDQVGITTIHQFRENDEKSGPYVRKIIRLLDLISQSNPQQLTEIAVFISNFGPVLQKVLQELADSLSYSAVISWLENLGLTEKSSRDLRAMIDDFDLVSSSAEIMVATMGSSRVICDQIEDRRRVRATPISHLDTLVTSLGGEPLDMDEREKIAFILRCVSSDINQQADQTNAYSKLWETVYFIDFTQLPSIWTKNNPVFLNLPRLNDEHDSLKRGALTKRGAVNIPVVLEISRK